MRVTASELSDDCIAPASVPPALRSETQAVDRLADRPISGTRAKVVHYIGSLNAGGAERQLCNLAREERQRDLDVRVFAALELKGCHAHYEPLLQKAGVPVRQAGASFDSRFGQLCTRNRRNLLIELPPFFHPYTADIWGELLVDPPDIFHAWLDYTNICGGVAALLAGVPVVILSTRNVNPTHFSYLSNPIYQPWYRFLSTSPRVHFINNSQPGARDYAEWLRLPRERFHVVRNGVDFRTVERPGLATIQRFRQELGIPTDAPLIVGIFRLSEEKQPLIFMEVVRRAMGRVRNLHAVVAGEGPYEIELRKARDEAGIAERVHLVGRRQDVDVIISAADVFLLTSRQEGTPNALLEAQWLGCPVVSTKAGGAVDAVSHGETGVLVEVGDIERLTDAVTDLLENRLLRARYGSAGPRFIMEQFGLHRMVNETLKVYDSALRTHFPPPQEKPIRALAAVQEKTK
ncbi:MAG: glycosyltransferase [Gammaproteobacteria bacterium]